MPDVGTLDAIRRMNPHGCGFVSTRRRFKTLDYCKFLERLARVGEEEDCLIHFRFATHGSVCRANCHPFREQDVYFMHNGVLGINTNGDMTDSETAFRTIICPEIDAHGFGSIEVQAAIRSILGASRFAFMAGGEVHLYGRFSELDGIYYSNLRWLR